MAVLFALGLVPVVGAISKGTWSAEASLGMALALFGGWHLVAEMAARL